jgi:hypothetical protein
MTDVEVLRQRTIRGEETMVANAVATARSQGRLVRVTDVHRLTTGEVEVVAIVRERRPAADIRPWFKRHPRWAATMVGILVGLVGFAAWLVYLVAVAVERNFEAIMFASALVAAVLLGLGHKTTKALGCCPCHKR